MLICTKNYFAFSGHKKLATEEHLITARRQLHPRSRNKWAWMCSPLWDELAATQRWQHFYTPFVKSQKFQASILFFLQGTHVDYNECILEMLC